MEHNIKLYGTKTCTFCRVAKEYFEEKGFSYKYIDIGEDTKARDEVTKAAGVSSVPIIEIDGEYIIGWKRSKVERALGINQD